MKLENITTFDLEQLEKYEIIYCLVSGGIDSTYLYELLKERFSYKVFPVNCFNPFESSDTLNKIAKDNNFIQIKAEKGLEFGKILKEAFLKLPESYKMKKYSKKVFGCCYYIKHKSFMNNPIFSNENSVVISGIKYSDGRQRQLWLKSLKDGITTSKGTVILNAPTFFHIHKNKQNYCYPFRDYKERELPEKIINQLKEKYPQLNHSGCYICPVLVKFENKIKKSGSKYDKERLNASIEYAIHLGLKKEKNKWIL